MSIFLMILGIAIMVAYGYRVMTRLDSFPLLHSGSTQSPEQVTPYIRKKNRSA